MAVAKFKTVIFADDVGAIDEHVEEIEGPNRAWKLVEYPGTDGLDAVNLGMGGRQITYRAWIWADHNDTLKQHMADIRNLDDGQSGTLILYAGCEDLGPCIIAPNGIRWGRFRLVSTGGMREVTIRFIELQTATSP